MDCGPELGILRLQHTVCWAWICSLTKLTFKPNGGMPICDYRTQEVEAGELWVQGQASWKVGSQSA